MLFILLAVAVLAFPASAIWACRTGGVRRLWAVTTAGIAIIVGGSLMMASGRFGNRVAETSGYGVVAFRTLLFSALTFIGPLLAVTVLVGARRDRLGGLYPVAVLAAFATTFAGSVAAIYLLWGLQ